MATSLASGVPINENEIWKGGCRIMLGTLTGASPATPFPTKIEDVITTEVAAAGYMQANSTNHWVDFGPTDDSGVKVYREWAAVPGIATDQRSYLLREGAIRDVKMRADATALDTSLGTLQYLWQFALTTQTIAAVATTGATYTVAQSAIAMGAPSSLQERMVCILQMDDRSNRLRMFAFRRARLAPAKDMSLFAKEVSRNAFTLEFYPDTTQTDGSDFGKYFEQTAP